MATAYVNGRFVSFAEAALPLSDTGLVWGAVITDRVRTYRGRLFRLADHVARFRQSCDLARVGLSTPDEELLAIANEIVARDYTGTDLAVAFLATPGPLPGFVPGSVVPIPTLIVHTIPIPTDRIERLCREGAVLIAVAASLGVDPRVKHRSRLPWWLAMKNVQDVDPQAEPVFIDPESGMVLETAAANLVAVIDGVVTSPPREAILPGISLAITLELATTTGLRVMERPFTEAELGSASEVSLTNSTFALAPVARIDSRRFPIDGPVYRQLRDAWSRMLDTDLPRDGPPAS